MKSANLNALSCLQLKSFSFQKIVYGMNQEHAETHARRDAGENARVEVVPTGGD